MRNTILAILMLFVITPSFANGSLTYESVQSYVGIYNKQVEAAPALLRGLVGSEEINVNIAMDNGSTFSLGFETENIRVSRIVEGGLQDPTIIVGTNEGAIDRIKGSGDPMTAFRKEVDAGQVRIEATNIITRLKIGAALSSTQLMKFFSSIFF